MAIKITNCLNCGERVSYDDKSERVFCKHCGYQVKGNSNTETYVKNVVKEAPVKVQEPY